MILNRKNVVITKIMHYIMIVSKLQWQIIPLPFEEFILQNFTSSLMHKKFIYLTMARCSTLTMMLQKELH